MGHHKKENEQTRRKLRKQRNKSKKRSILNRGRQFCNVDPCVSNSSISSQVSTNTTSQFKNVLKISCSQDCDVNKSAKETEVDKRQKIQNSDGSNDKPKKTLTNFVNDPLITRYHEYLVLQQRISHIKDSTKGFTYSN